MIWLKSKAALVGAALLYVLALLTRLQYLKNKANKQEQRANLLDARLTLSKVQKKISKEVSKDTEKKKEKIKKEVGKDAQDFKGLDNLSDPNNY